MRVLVAPDGFTGTLSAPEAAAAVAEGWRAVRPGDDLDLCPLSDGGPGFVEVLTGALGGRVLEVVVQGPLGAPTTARVLVGGGTAHVESAQACGSALVPRDERDALAASTTGVGQLLVAARSAGARRVVVGLGGSCTTDAGAGLLAALGAGPADLLGRGGGSLAAVRPAHLADLGRVRQAWAGTELVVASDVDVPLLGPRGAARGFGPQKGASSDQVERLEAALNAFVSSAEASTGASSSTGGAGDSGGWDGRWDGLGPRALADEPGAGAAGGLGWAFLLLGGHRAAGSGVVASAVGLGARVAAADLVLTGEGCLDWQSLRGKVVARVVAAGARAGTPVAALAGQVSLAPREVRAAGLSAAVAVAATPAQLAASLAEPAAALARRAAELAASWPRLPAAHA